MLISSISNFNLESNSKVNFQKSHVSKRRKAEVYDEGMSPSAKRKVLLSSMTGVGIASAIIAKKQGFSLNPKVIFSQNPKNWAMLKIYSKGKPNEKLMEIEEPQILALASGSAIGGLAGGAMFDDKKYFKGKVRETVSQMLGNVLVPVAWVASAAHIYDKNKSSILSKVPQFKGDGNMLKYVNKALKAVPSLALTGLALGAGIITGNKLSNWINEKVYHRHVERDIKTTDFAPHVDDLSLAVTLMADKSPVATAITRTVPAFLCVPGYEIGTHRD